MRKILFILSDLPFPRDKNGITLIDYEILTRLPTDYIIDILILNHGEIAKKDKELFNVVFPRVQSVHHQKTNKLKMYINIISRALFNFSVFTSLKISTSKYIDGFDVVYISSVSIDLDVK
ncbi:hypothetical protein D8Y91_004974, partial [Escherichia coli]|nr:hypothetical protein [Escherichia coli]